MTLKRWDGSAFQDVATAKRWDGTSWVDLTVAKRWDGTTWVDITLPGGSGGLSVTIDRSSITGSVFSPEPAPLFRTVTSGAVTVTATGGTGAGPTYSWVRISGSSSVAADSPTAAATTFTATVSKNDEAVATFRCTVTRGVETQAVDCLVTLRYNTNL